MNFLFFKTKRMWLEQNLMQIINLDAGKVTTFRKTAVFQVAQLS